MDCYYGQTDKGIDNKYGLSINSDPNNESPEETKQTMSAENLETSYDKIDDIINKLFPPKLFSRAYLGGK